MRITTRLLLCLICVGVVYFISAKIGLSLALSETVVSPVWPPAGVALGAILLFGFRIWPAIAAGAFLANYATGLPIETAFSIACGNTLEAILGGYFILTFVDPSRSLNRPQTIFYVVLACMLSTIVGATIGSTSIYFKGLHHDIHYGYLWLTWWLGDLVGAVILAPLIFAWGQKSYWRWDRKRFLEFLLILTVLVAAAHLVFRGSFNLVSQRTYLTIPFVVWASFRFGRRGASSACFLLSAVAIWYTKHSSGPFVSEDLNESLLSLQAFMGVTTVMGLALGAAVTQSRLAASLQSALYRISGITTSVKEIKDFYAALHGIVGELMYAKNFYISLYDPDTQMFHIPYFVDEYETLSPVPVKLNKGLTAYVLRTGQPLLATPEKFKELLAQNAIEDIGIPSVDWLGVPLKTGDRCIGVIAVQSYKEEIRFGEREKDILIFVSQHAAAAIERKRSEEVLRASEEQYRSFFEEDLTADYICRPDGQLLACNPAFARIFGFLSVKEAVTSNASALYPDADYESFLDLVRNQKKLEYFESQLRKRNGDRLHVIQNAIGEFDETGDLIRIKGYIFDITQHKNLEEQLRQAQKIKAIGQLAGGVAHDFNNILMAITGYCELVLLKLKGEDPLRADVIQIQKAANHGASLTRQLLAFSRKQVLTPKVVDLNQCLHDMEGILRRLIGEDVELNILPANKLGLVKVDPGQFEQLIFNLAVNSREAMQEGGRLTIETSNIFLDEGYAHRHIGVSPGAYVMVSIRDTGCGMDKATSARVFEPFFTTKEKGTGLGLATVYGIVEQSGGCISVHSEKGKGTTFEISLPTIDQPIELIAFQQTGSDLPCSGTILLVDDNESVRSAIGACLKIRGFVVHEARSPHEALEIFQNQNGSINLVITDMVMPEMSGKELAKRLVLQKPNLRTIYISGYSEESVLQQPSTLPFSAFLMKPVSIETLIERIQHLLKAE